MVVEPIPHWWELMHLQDYEFGGDIPNTGRISQQWDQHLQLPLIARGGAKENETEVFEM